jgi:hypothetical protein
VDLPNQLPDSDEAEAELELQFTAEEEVNPGAFNPDTSNPVVDNDNNATRDYVTVKWLAKERIAALVGTTLTIAAARGNSIAWNVVDKHVPPEERIVEAGFDQKKQYGLKYYDVRQYKKSEVLAHMFLWLSNINWKEKVDIISKDIITSRKNIKKFTCEEFLVGLGLLVGAAEFLR